MSHWESSPNDFVAEEEGGGGEDGQVAPLGGARFAGLALIRDLCDAFPHKVNWRTAGGIGDVFGGDGSVGGGVVAVVGAVLG